MHLNSTRLTTCLSLAFALGTLSSSHAQKLFSSDGKEMLWSDVTLQGSSVAWRQTEASTGRDRIINIPATNIVRLDFPEPADLQDADAAINRGDAATALEKIDSVIKQFSPFKATPGSYWSQAALTKLEALALQGTKSTEEYDKLRAEIKTINLAGAAQVRFGGIDALIDFAKGLSGPAKTTVIKLIPQTDDASVLAKLYILLGDIHFKLGDYPSALEAYLSVSVFYGSQADQLPIAELGAARSMSKMDRLEDARDMLNGLKERYPTSPQAQSAKKELDALTKILGAAMQAKADEADKAEKATPEKSPEPTK
jgi:tetratricopeptide (TPR) repeat protein